MHGGRQAGGFHGYAHGDIILTNQGHGACSLNGDPTIRLLTASGSPLAITQRPDLRPPRPATLSPGGTATIVLSWSNWCGADPGPLTIEVVLGRGGPTVTGPFNGPPDYDLVPACIDRTRPSTVSVVDAYLRP